MKEVAVGYVENSLLQREIAEEYEKLENLAVTLSNFKKQLEKQFNMKVASEA